jgi:hypothetical protein
MPREVSRENDMLKNTILGTLLVGLVLAGCGSSSSSKNDAGASNAGTTGSNAGTTGGNAGNTGTGTAGSGGTGGQGSVTCDTTMTSVAKCGSETCTAPTQPMCQISCCTSDNKCGEKNTSNLAAQYGVDKCAVPAVHDARCDSLVPAGAKTFGGVGCCQANGDCGLLIAGQCSDLGALAGAIGRDAGTVTPVKCTDAANMTGNDAGN